MLNGRQYKFAVGVASGLSSVEAYQAAYPQAGSESARRSASLLMTNHDVLEEVERIRGKADSLGEQAVLAILEKRRFLARLVRARISELPDNSDLWHEITQTEHGTKRKLPCKLRAILLDNDLASEGAQAGGQNELVILIKRLTGMEREEGK